MSKNNYEMIPTDISPISTSGIQLVLNEIRPSWKGKILYSELKDYCQ